MLPKLLSYINSLNIEAVASERKSVLDQLVNYIQENISQGKTVRLNFVCTHNSRRSHLSQIWAQTMAFHYKVNNVQCYSSGTEATALFANVVTSLSATGFQIDVLAEGKNPIYSIKFDSNEAAIIGFSKTIDHPFNPQSDFAAIMTCAQADEACPFVAGASARIPVRYEDPKVFDNSPDALAKYTERSNQIATEMAYVFSQILI